MTRLIRELVLITVLLIVFCSPVSAAETNDIGTVPPSVSSLRTMSLMSTGPAESTVDNGDGTYTFTQTINKNSGSPYYTAPSNGGGFGIYSWEYQDYGWTHTFPDYSKSGISITSAKLIVRAWDVDSETYHGYDGEYDGVTGDGNWLNPQYLQGYDDQWSTTTFDVDPSTLNDGELNIFLDIDMHERGWATQLDNSILEVTYSNSNNNPPYAPELSISPSGNPGDDDPLVVTVTGPDPEDPDGDSVTVEYKWFVDTGTGYFVEDQFAGRGTHTGNTIPAADTVIGDTWRVQVTFIDEHGARGTSNTVTFGKVGGTGGQPPIADAGGDKTSSSTEVTLDGSESYDPDGTITGYKWEIFTNGAWETIGNSNTINYDFGADGSYQVRLTVTDNGGLTDSDNAYITIDTSGTGGGGSTQVPEFPTIALPVVSLLGIMFFVSRKTREQ